MCCSSDENRVQQLSEGLHSNQPVQHVLQNVDRHDDARLPPTVQGEDGEVGREHIGGLFSIRSRACATATADSEEEERKVREVTRDTAPYQNNRNYMMWVQPSEMGCKIPTHKTVWKKHFHKTNFEIISRS